MIYYLLLTETWSKSNMTRKLQGQRRTWDPRWHLVSLLFSHEEKKACGDTSFKLRTHYRMGTARSTLTFMATSAPEKQGPPSQREDPLEEAGYEQPHQSWWWALQMRDLPGNVNWTLQGGNRDWAMGSTWARLAEGRETLVRIKHINREGTYSTQSWHQSEACRTVYTTGTLSWMDKSFLTKPEVNNSRWPALHPKEQLEHRKLFYRTSNRLAKSLCGRIKRKGRYGQHHSQGLSQITWLG